MKMTLEHPDSAGITAELGIDRAVGWFSMVRKRGRLGVAGAVDLYERLEAMRAD